MSDDVLNLLISEAKETIKLNNNYQFEKNFESFIPTNYSGIDFLKHRNVSNIDFNVNSGEHFEQAGSNGLYLELEHQIKLLNFKREELNDENSFYTNYLSDPCNKSYLKSSSIYNNQKIQNQPNFQINLEKIRIDDKNTNEFNENFFKQIRDRLDSHLKETENVINQLKKPQQLQTPFTTEPFSGNELYKNFSNSTSLTSDEKDIKYKIIKAGETNKELQNFCESYFHQLQNSFKILMDEKDKIIKNKTFEINDLRNESLCLKKKLSENTANSNEIESNDTLAKRMESYEELFNQVFNILRDEGNKKGNLYVFNESNEGIKENLIKKVEILINGLNRCFDDYRNKIENSEAALNEMQKTLESKIQVCIQTEKDLIENCDKKCGIIRDEYDRLINIKQDKIEKLKREADDLNSTIVQLKKELEKTSNSKEKEINKIKHQNDSLKIELESLNNEFNNLKNRFEYINEQEKQNQINTYNSIINLENENKKLNNKCIQLTKEIADYQQNNETIKDQLKKYNQLIENLNERIRQEDLNKKEIQSSLEKVEENLKKETSEKWDLNLKCNDLEKRVDILQNDVIMHQNCKEIIKNLKKENQKNEQMQKQNLEKIHQIQTSNEQYQSKIKNQNQQISRIKSEKSKIEIYSNKVENELDEARKKLDNTASMLDELSKENLLIKQEKLTFENILKEDALKIKGLKEENETMLELNSKLKTQNETLNKDLESLKNDFQDKSRLYDSAFKEKEKLIESVNFLENKVATIENNFKAVTKNLSESIADKNLQISKLENSVTLYEKETNLMRQYENLQKNQEDSKVIEFVMTIEQKMKKKMKKIESLKVILQKLEFENENFKKEKIDNQAMLNNAHTENKNLLRELQILKEKNSHFEKTLEKSARKYIDCEKKKEHLKNELIKFKKKLSDFNLIDEISKIHQQLNIGNDSTQNIRNNLVTLEKIFDLLFSSKLKSNNLNTDIQNEGFPKVNQEMDPENDETKNFENEGFLKSSDMIEAATLVNIENGFTFLSLIGDELKKDANEVMEILKQ